MVTDILEVPGSSEPLGRAKFAKILHNTHFWAVT